MINAFHKAMLKIYDDSKAIGYTPSKFRQMVANEGGLKTAKKLINSNKLSDGFVELVNLNRLDLTVEALMLKKEFESLFTVEELEIAKDRLKKLNYYDENKNNYNNLPPLISHGRDREYRYYTDDLKGRVIYEHLINNQHHRWMDINILDRNGNTNGRDSANILYYLGMKAEYRGYFENQSLDKVIEILEHKGMEYQDIVRLLKIYKRSENLLEIMTNDIKALEIENDNRVEGSQKMYLINTYERNPKNRKRAIEIHGLDCIVCGFNFEKTYGDLGKDFIEVHHLTPLNKLEKATEIDPLTDLVPLCANCHRMVHRRFNNIITITELQNIINKL